MKHEKKEIKKSAELNEEELDGVAGGFTNTLEYRAGGIGSASTLEHRPGDGMSAELLGQKVAQPTSLGVNPAVSPMSVKPQGGGTAHSL